MKTITKIYLLICLALFLIGTQCCNEPVKTTCTSIDGYVSPTPEVKEAHDDFLIQTMQYKINLGVIRDSISETDGKIFMVKYTFDVKSYWLNK